jgi:hypothetical protein
MMTKVVNSQGEPTYLDIQAQVGITKHIGGFEATNVLLMMCHNEVFWIKPVSQEMNRNARRELGADLLTVEAWQELWNASGLSERLVHVCEINASLELRGRIQWVGLGWAMGALGRLFVLSLTNPAARQAVREQWNGTLEKTSSMGYGLFAGKK